MKRNSLGRPVSVMRSMYFVLCGSVFLISSYMSVYLRSLPFTNDVSVGLLMSLCYCITTAAQPVIGFIADHAATKNRVMQWMLLLVAAALWLLILPKHGSYLTLVPCVVLVYATFTTPMMLADTIVVENLDRAGVSFGAVKGFSSGGAAAAALVIYLLSLFVSVKPSSAFLLSFVYTMLSLIPLHFMPPTKGHAFGLRADKGSAPLKSILKNRRLMLLLSYLLCLFIPIQATNVFLGIYYSTPLGLDAGMGMFGLYNGICIALETCFMLFGTRLWSKMDIYDLLTLAGLSACLRSLVIFLAPNVFVMQLSALGHVFLFAPLWSRLSPYVNSIVTKETRATGQAAWSIMTAGVGPMLGSAAGGWAADRFGIRNLFLAAASMLFTVAAVFYFLFRRQRLLDCRAPAYIDDPAEAQTE